MVEKKFIPADVFFFLLRKISSYNRNILCSFTRKIYFWFSDNESLNFNVCFFFLFVQCQTHDSTKVRDVVHWQVRLTMMLTAMMPYSGWWWVRKPTIVYILTKCVCMSSGDYEWSTYYTFRYYQEENVRIYKYIARIIFIRELNTEARVSGTSRALYHQRH